MAVRFFLALAGAVAASALLACGADAAAPAGDAPPPIGASPGAEPAPPVEAAPRPPSPAPSTEPPCTRAPCAARPIVFVHGQSGSNSDFSVVLDSLVREPRWDAYRFAGTTDHAAWPSRGIPRRSWLFAFDYYVEKGDDARGSYTAGPGRIGSNSQHACASPSGAGDIVASGASYAEGTTHDYAADLASMIDDVLRATGAAKVDLVAHSMGGLVVRSFLAFHGGSSKVERVLLLASPHLGVAGASLGTLFGVGKPWMTAHELTELDPSGFAKSTFLRCGESAEAGTSGPWTKKLLEVEVAKPVVPALHTMSASRDLLVSYESAHHPQSLSHVEVEGVDHAGLLRAPETIARVKELCGGAVP